MFCKTIILSNSENLNNNAPKGILTLSKENNQVKGKIRLYNICTLPQNTKIGLYINEKVIISSIISKPNHYEFDLNENIDISQNIYCALIDNDNNKKVLLEGGSFNGFYFSDSPFDAVIEAKDEQLEQEINASLKNEPCENCNCSNCEYKNYFYQNYSNLNSFAPNSKCDTQFNPQIKDNVPKFDFIDEIQSNILENIENEVLEEFKNINPFQKDNLNSTNTQTMVDKPENIKKVTDSDNSNNTQQEKLEFLNEIIYQLDEMFERYPADDMLNSIIPDSKFIKVDGENPYVLGVMYENKMLKYIAYGVPANYNTLPPKDLGQHYQWLPLNPRDVMSDGYFMIYQDALNGSIVEINFEEEKN